jgi:DNA-directed RNA polymerase specialized sigma24 family protein
MSSLTTEQLVVAQRLAREVAHRVAKKWNARVLEEDARQEALVSILQAAKGYDPALGTWAAWCHAVAEQGIRRFIWRNKAPVVPPRPEAETRLKPASGWRHSPVVGLEACRQADPTPLPDEALHKARVLARARKLLRRLDHTPRKLGYAAAVEGRDTTLLAKAFGLPVQKVHDARRYLVRRASHSQALNDLLVAL